MSESPFRSSEKSRFRGSFFSLLKSLAEFRVRRRESDMIRFLPRPVRGRKHVARSKRRIVRFQRTTEAQSAAKISQKSGFATFLTRKAAEGRLSFACNSRGVVLKYILIK